MNFPGFGSPNLQASANSSSFKRVRTTTETKIKNLMLKFHFPPNPEGPIAAGPLYEFAGTAPPRMICNANTPGHAPIPTVTSQKVAPAGRNDVSAGAGCHREPRLVHQPCLLPFVVIVVFIRLNHGGGATFQRREPSGEATGTKEGFSGANPSGTGEARGTQVHRFYSLLLTFDVGRK